MDYTYWKLPTLTIKEHNELLLICDSGELNIEDKALKYLQHVIPKASLYDTFWVWDGVIYHLCGNSVDKAAFAQHNRINTLEATLPVKTVEVIKEVPIGISEEFALKLVTIAKGDANEHLQNNIIKGY